MKRKRYKDMTPDEQYEENLRRAKRDSRQARVISLAAIAVSAVNIIRAFLKALETLP